MNRTGGARDLELFTQDFRGRCQLVEAFLADCGVQFVTGSIDCDGEALQALISSG